MYYAGDRWFWYGGDMAHLQPTHWDHMPEKPEAMT
jgi:hypothetical protein